MKATLTSALLLAALSGTMLVSAGNVSADDVAPQTSTADFTVDATTTTPGNGILTLDTVPGFSYGTLTSAQIYSGVSNLAASTAGDVTVTDTRAGKTDWSLSATMGAFTSATQTLNGGVLNLAVADGGAGISSNAIALTAGGTAETIAASDGTNHGTNKFGMTADASTLTLAPNPGATLTKGTEAYVATIDWNLSSTVASIPTA